MFRHCGIALSGEAVANAPGAEGILISCGGLRTLAVARPLEERHGLPVVSSTPAAFWAAVRLVGHSGRLPGYGRMLEQSTAPVH
jgi:arylmalonate decarboxylase